MKALTGLGVVEFYDLVVVFSPLYDAWNESRRSDRKRNLGAGGQWSLEGYTSKLFYILFYVKCYPTFDVAGFFFNVDKSRTCRWTHDWLPLLEKALGKKVELPKRKIQSVAEFYECFPKVKELFIDGTERRIQRPKYKQEQDYSGKKKSHTKKNLIISDKKRRILMLSPTVSGKEHDYSMLKNWNIMQAIPKDIPILVDLGFQGIRSDFSHTKLMIPHKKPKNGELSETEKSQNKAFSSVRVLVEHAIGGVKRLKSLTDPYRNRKDNFSDQLMMVGCGLWNYHLAQ